MLVCLFVSFACFYNFVKFCVFLPTQIVVCVWVGGWVGGWVWVWVCVGVCVGVCVCVCVCVCTQLDCFDCCSEGCQLILLFWLSWFEPLGRSAVDLRSWMRDRCSETHPAVGWQPLWRPGAGIMETVHRQVTTVFTVQPSFHHRHSTNPVS